jgi:hypothetical protein
MTEKRVLVSDDNMASLVCPKCGNLRVVNVEQYVEKTSRIKCKCVCGHAYPVILDRRKFYRVQTNLPGLFYTQGGRKKNPMRVTDISRSGVQFKLDDAPEFEVGERGLVEFQLDDTRKTPVRRYLIVRKIEEKTVGAEFEAALDYENTEPVLMYI